MNMDESSETIIENETSDIVTAVSVERGSPNVNPWLQLEELFTFSSEESDANNLHFKCKLCPPS